MIKEKVWSKESNHNVYKYNIKRTGVWEESQMEKKEKKKKGKACSNRF